MRLSSQVKFFIIIKEISLRIKNKNFQKINGKELYKYLLDELKSEEELLNIKKRGREQEKNRVGGKARSIRFGFLGPKKKSMQNKAGDLGHEVKILESQLHSITEERKIVEDKLSAFQNIERKKVMIVWSREVAEKIVHLQLIF